MGDLGCDIKWSGNLHEACIYVDSEVHKGYTEGKFKLYYEEVMPLIPKVLLSGKNTPCCPTL